MELEVAASVALAVLIVAYGFIFGVLKRVNEWIYVSRLGEKRASLPPGDMGWPLVGKMRSFLRAFRSDDPDSFLSTFISRFGATGIYKTYMFGSPSIIVCKPETCRRVLTDDQNFKLGYPKAVKVLTGRRSFHSISNAEHKRLRRLTAAPITGSEALSMYVPGIEENIVASLEEWSSSDQPVEFLTGMKKVTFKIITNIFFGLDQVDFNFKTMEILYGDLARGMKSAPINFPGFTFHRGVKARRELIKILQAVVDERKALKGRNGSITRKNMLDMLMEVEDEDKMKLEEEDIIDILLMYLLAGHETSAHGTMWAALYLHEHPDILQKAREEQEEIISRRPATQSGLTLKEIRQSQYLTRVVDETLRRISLSFAVFREAKADVNVNGYLIPKGWKVMVSSRAVHMDPENYLDPKKFDPSRWENIKAKAGAFLPFGAGSRFCPGSDLAKLEISIFLHQFLLHYKLERVNPTSSVSHLPLPHPSDNCLVRFEKAPLDT
ncbi:ent-kaurenoic acid oxidase 2 [Eucalyptus grandis]|uniref:ent-kaurenoic acid oxidase 2 n=1 Tax=Eucalyptus grandis TaxID=71139 RepID=UPI00192EB22A|nr:ent-kaurenoic acid oxidase 2 [Eucalyptus grandis]